MAEEAATAEQLERSWPQESPFKEELELLREGDGKRLDSKRGLGGRKC